ncbi:5732_t:CDS:1 [Cetraspora pellucida]|uniref:5732_t:CDS:1 n=1 Tax=Cetraspora pellucida TaxID=1433469 RepID=A0A9N9JAJ2_9GLOM|nr:5732_t:CDS:1 [Cetraspora pellucida]
MDSTLTPKDELIADYFKLFNDRDNNGDVEITIPGNENKILAHSLVLETRSSYFKQSLSEKWAKKNNDGKFTLTLSDIEYDIIIIILKYLYYAEIYDHEDFNVLSKLLVASDQFNIVTLSNCVHESIVKKTLVFIKKNLFDLFEFIMKYQIFTTIDKKFMSEIAKNPCLLFNSKDFVRLNEEMLQKILLCNELKISESEICEYLIKWSNVENNETKLGSLFKLIRFHQMKKDEFFDLWKKYKNKIISDELLEDILGFFMCNHPQNLDKTPFRLGNYQISRIVGKHEYFLEISSWIDNDNGKGSFRFDLIFDDSFFGENFHANSFHKICDGPFSTITLFALEDYIVGGYNPVGWFSENKWIYCESSFIFAYKYNPKDAKLSRVSEKERAISRNIDYGPWFGAGPDLCVQHGSKKIELKPKSYPKLFDFKDYKFHIIEIFKVTRIYDNVT